MHCPDCGSEVEIQGALCPPREESWARWFWRMSKLLDCASKLVGALGRLK